MGLAYSGNALAKERAEEASEQIARTERNLKWIAGFVMLVMGLFSRSSLPCSAGRASNACQCSSTLPFAFSRVLISLPAGEINTLWVS